MACSVLERLKQYLFTASSSLSLLVQVSTP